MDTSIGAGETIVSFGRHAGKPLRSLSGSYLSWIAGFKRLQVENLLVWAKLAEEVLDERKRSVGLMDFSALIRKCGISRDLEASKRIHARVLGSDHSGSTLIGNLLVQMYGKCGAPDLAREAFEAIDAKNSFSWTMMIMAYTQNGQMREALNFYRAMDTAKVRPTSFFFSGVLAACLEPGDLPTGMRIHSHIVDCGCGSDIVVATGLIGMYSRCGSVDRAREVFDRMSYRDTVAWTAMIAAYAHTGHPRQAIELFKAMDVAPNAFTVSCVLGACSDLGAVEEGRLFYKRVVSEGLEATTPVLNSLLDMLSKCGRLDEAREVFSSMGVRRDVISWSSMVAALVRHESFTEALEFYRRMDLEGVRPDLFVFASVLDACSRLGGLEQGKAVHERLRAGGSELDVVVSSALVNMYAKCKSLKDAKQVFDRISNKDVVAWTTMIVAFSQDGHSSEALELYEQMVARVEKPDAYVYASVLRACSSVGSLSKGREIHARILSEKMELDFVIKNSLLNMYLKCANLEEVRRMFDLTPQKDTILVTMMISAYAQGGHPEKALDLYHEMETSDVRPDGFTYASVINACTGMGALADGMVVHREIVRDGFDGDPVVQNSLVDMYSKCGSLGEARAVFDEMVKRDVATWTALFSGYAKHGFNNEALETFWCMALESMALDEIIFTTVLQACSHLGLVDEGRDYFVSMRRDFGLAPGVEHYVGMVDVLGRAGRLKEAEELLGGMPYEPTPVAWTTILGACKIHSDTERAKRMKADTGEEEETACMLMSNIYAASASKNELSRREVLN